MLAETELSCAFFDGFPITRGHSLVIPKRHVRSIWEMTAEEYNDAFSLARTVKDLLLKQFAPDGFKIDVSCDVRGKRITGGRRIGFTNRRM